jgi:hypothetical protein
MHDQEVERRKLDLERKRKVMEAQIAAIRAEFEAQETEAMNIIGQEHSATSSPDAGTCGYGTDPQSGRETGQTERKLKMKNKSADRKTALHPPPLPQKNRGDMGVGANETQPTLANRMPLFCACMLPGKRLNP